MTAAGGLAGADVVDVGTRSGAPAAAGSDLGRMTLVRLRSYRHDLLKEELKASYWRRLLQGRRDLLLAGARPGDRTATVAALTEVRGTVLRHVVLALHPDDGMPVLPHLPALWAHAMDGDTASRADLLKRLAAAESVMSSYRAALHVRVDRASAELVARYREDPTLCYIALEPPRRGHWR